MNNKIFIWMSVFLMSITIASAQTGLFNTETGTQFAITGIIIVVIILVLREIAKGRIKVRQF